MAIVTKTQVGNDAILSACEQYRYRLTRMIGRTGTCISWVMFNPSTADASKNDATIRKVIGFSARWGYSFIDVYNLFAFRSTNPLNLWKAEDPIGDDNEEYLKMIPWSGCIVAAWGGIKVPKEFSGWVDKVRRMLDCRKASCLGTTANGEPRHPLMLSYATQLRPYDAECHRTMS